MSNEEILNTGKCQYEDALKKSGFKVDFKYTKIEDKNQKIDFKILFGLNHHSTKQYPQMLEKLFDCSTDIFQSQETT